MILYPNIGQGDALKQLKLQENWTKAPLSSPDVLDTKDFTFAKYANTGDSGNMLLATHKANPSTKYLVKHAAAECACNEFMYYSVAKHLGVRVPETKLFQITDKHRLFRTDFVVGSRFIESAVFQPSMEIIRSIPDVFEQWLKMKALDLILNGDDLQYLLDKNGLLYRIDTTQSFRIYPRQFSSIEVKRILPNGENSHKMMTQLMNSYLRNLAAEDEHDFCFATKNILEKNDLKCVSTFMLPFTDYLALPENALNKDINTLCYFYPDFLGDYYVGYFAILRNKVQRFCDYVRSNYKWHENKSDSKE